MDPSVPSGLGLVAFAAAGVALGTVSGLTPGLHVNTLALLSASVAPALEADPLGVGVAILAAGVVHSFLDVVPALALGVPDAAMAPTALPGHRLVLAGRGREALRVSAVASALAVVVAVPLALPVTWAMVRAYPTVRAHLPLVLAGVVVALLATDRNWAARLGGGVALSLSTALGWVVLDLHAPGIADAGDVLTPLFAGLFGVPVLLDALGGGGVPPQEDARITLPPTHLGATAFGGSVAGALVGYLPGVSAAVAATLTLPAVERYAGPGEDGETVGAREFLAASSGANTSNAVFALLALLALGTPRTGVMVALDRAAVPLDPGALAFAVGVGAVAGFVLVLVWGDRYLAAAGRVGANALSLGVIAALAALSWAFAGPVGLAVLGASTAVGLVPPRLGARRVYLMGVLLGPLALGL